MLANAWILLNKKVVDLLNGKAITTAMMVKNIFVIFHNNETSFLFIIDNNNAACNWDGGDCCGGNVNTQFCTACECLDPAEQGGCESPQWEGDGYCDDGNAHFLTYSENK